MRRNIGVVAALTASVLVASCQGSGSDATTTTRDSSLLSLPAPPSTTIATTTTLSPIDSLSAPEYQIIQRTPGDTGDTVIVLLDPTSYDTITDIDVQDLIAEIVDLFPPIATAHIIDDPAAANVVGDPEATKAMLDTIADHYLARLDNGFHITFLGPLAESGSNILGS